MVEFYFVFASAVALSTTAAYFSIAGLIAIFSAYPISVGIMGLAMEFAKIVTSIWLHKNWSIKSFIKYYLSAAVFLLMCITSMGVYGFLSKSYAEKSGEGKQEYIQRDFIEKQISLLDEDISRNQAVLTQLDKAIDAYLSSGKTTAALRNREAQKSDRKAAENAIKEATEKKKELVAQKLVLEKSISEVEVEVGPIKYIADLLVGNSENALDKAVRIVILLLIFAFDPLAIMLMVAAQYSYEKANQKEYVELPPRIYETKTSEPENTSDVTISKDSILNIDVPQTSDEQDSVEEKKLSKKQQAIARKQAKLETIAKKFD